MEETAKHADSVIDFVLPKLIMWNKARNTDFTLTGALLTRALLDRILSVTANKFLPEKSVRDY